MKYSELLKQMKVYSETITDNRKKKFDKFIGKI